MTRPVRLHYGHAENEIHNSCVTKTCKHQRHENTIDKYANETYI